MEHLTEPQQAKITACLNAGDPNGEVNLAWQCYQQLRSIYHAAPAKGREIAIIEMPFYRADGEGWAVQRFAPAPAAVETVLALGDRDRAMKRQMFAAHRTQAGALAFFDAETERFRIAPAYDFSTLPNGGDLHYERHDWGMTGAQWVALVEAASRELGVERAP